MQSQMLDTFPDSKVHGANMGPIWGREDPGGPHVGPMNFAIWVVVLCKIYSYVHSIHAFVACAITNMSPLVTLEFVKMKTPVAASDDKFVKETTFPFRWFAIVRLQQLYLTRTRLTALFYIQYLN